MFAVRDTSDFDSERDGCGVRRPTSVSATVEPSVHILYLNFLTDMLSTLRKIDEKEPASIGTYYISRFEVFMEYSNAVEVLCQLVYVGSAGNNVSSMQEKLFHIIFAAYRSEALGSSHEFRVLSHKSRMRTSMSLPSNAP